MKAQVFTHGKPAYTDFSHPIDISLPLDHGSPLSAFYLPPPNIAAVRGESFVGSVAEGGSCNCETITLAPHGNGTHTECVGHISRERISINDCLKNFFFEASLISVRPQSTGNGDRVITEGMLKEKLPDITEALIVRSYPNGEEKKIFCYSGTNPAYFEPAALRFLRESGVKHLLCDLPSVDREEDGGLLLAHHEFWNYPDSPRYDATITELVFVPDEIPDGRYFLHFQIMSIQSDASPSKPVLYPLSES